MTIRATCDKCGIVVMTTNTDVKIRHNLDDGALSYRFQCPTCNERVERVTDWSVAALLATAGCPTEEWYWPPEVFEVHTGDPFTYDDLLSFHETLESLDGVPQ